MKILKLLSKKNFSIFIIITLFFFNNLLAEDEPVDIWDVEKKIEENSSNEILENNDLNNIDTDLENKILDSNSNIIDTVKIKENKINIVGLYDPEENGLNMDIWSSSNGNEIKFRYKKLYGGKLNVETKPQRNGIK